MIERRSCTPLVVVSKFSQPGRRLPDSRISQRVPIIITLDRPGNGS